MPKINQLHKNYPLLYFLLDIFIHFCIIGPNEQHHPEARPHDRSSGRTLGDYRINRTQPGTTPTADQAPAKSQRFGLRRIAGSGAQKQGEEEYFETRN